MGRGRTAIIAVLLLLLTLGVGFASKDLVAQSNALPASTQSFVGIATDLVAKDRRLFTTWQVEPNADDSAYQTTLLLGYTLNGSPSANSRVEAAILGGVQGADVACDGSSSVTSTSFEELSSGLQDAVTRAKFSTTNHTNFTPPAADTPELLRARSDLGGLTGVAIGFDTVPGSQQADGSYNISGAVKCIVKSIDLFKFQGSTRFPARDFTGTLTTPPAGMSVKNGGETLSLYNQANVFLNGRGQPSAYSTGYTTADDGTFQWDLSKSPNVAYRGRTFSDEPGVSANFRDNSSSWHRELALVVIGALLGWLGGTVIQLVAGSPPATRTSPPTT